MSRQADVYGIPSFRATIGTGTAIQIGPFPGQLAGSIKLLSGGTLEIGAWGPSFVGAGFSGVYNLMGVTVIPSIGQTFGQMYPLSLTEVFSVNLSGAVVLYASGATCVVAIASGRSAP